MKRVIPRPQADRDIDAALSYYASENPRLARELLREITRASDSIRKMPGMGSPRLSRELNVEGLRTYALSIFPYLLLYFERDDHIDLARVMHSHRDFETLSLGIE